MGNFDTTLRFDGDREVDLDLTPLALSGSYILDDRWSARASVGVLLDGTLQSRFNPTGDFDPGGMAALGLEYRARSNQGYSPAVDLSFSLGASWAQTIDSESSQSTDYFAADARLGARAGWVLTDNTFTYAAARVFGGPVNWELDGEDVRGTDIHHYQLAVGAAAQLGPVGIFAEWAGLGEKGLSAGLSTTW